MNPDLLARMRAAADVAGKILGRISLIWDGQIVGFAATAEEGRVFSAYLAECRPANVIAALNALAKAEQERDAFRTACIAARNSIGRFPGSVHDRAIAKIDKALGDRGDYPDPDEAALAEAQARIREMEAQ